MRMWRGVPETDIVVYEVKDIRLPGPLRLQYAECGSPSGIPVILLHGVTDSWHSFEPVLPHLPANLRVFALTQRGHGDADRPVGGYTFDQMAADVAAFMDLVEVRHAFIVGHSMGAGVAQRFAVDFPDKVRGLVLAASFASMHDNPGVIEFTESVIMPLGETVPVEVAREFQQSTLAQPIVPAMLDLFVRESLKVPAWIWKTAFVGFLESDLSKELNRIKTPTLIVWGDQDVFCPRADQDELLSGIRGARLTVYTGAGHALHWEQPERFARDLAGFIFGLPHRP